MIEFVFLDLDDTILDFHRAEHIALSKTLRTFGIEPTQEALNRYTAINRAHWQRLERKELTREQVVVGRFSVFLQELGVPADPKEVAEKYEELLSQRHEFLPGAEDALIRLSRKYKLYLASNGTARVQNSRLKNSGIGKYFEEIFISQEIGADKPDKLYFDRCAERIPGYDPAKAVMVGDSLTSDIQGGINAGMRTVWINLRRETAPENITADHELQALSQLEALLEEL